MGKGDKKTKRGKIVNRSYGKLRQKKSKPSFIASPKKEVLVEEVVKEKAPAKKRTTKKEDAPVAKKATAKKTEKKVKDKKE